MKISAEITNELKILNLNILNDNNELLQLSIPTKDNVLDLKDELVYSLYSNGRLINQGKKDIIDIFNLFK